MEISQMKMLHVVTEHAQQRVTFNCKNVVVKDNSLKFKFFNDQSMELGKKSSAVLIKTITNECKVSITQLTSFLLRGLTAK